MSGCTSCIACSHICKDVFRSGVKKCMCVHIEAFPIHWRICPCITLQFSPLFELNRSNKEKQTCFFSWPHLCWQWRTVIELQYAAFRTIMWNSIRERAILHWGHRDCWFYKDIYTWMICEWEKPRLFIVLLYRRTALLLYSDICVAMYLSEVCVIMPFGAGVYHYHGAFSVL